MWRTGLGLTGDRPISYLDADPRGRDLFRYGLLVATVLLIGFAWSVGRRLARPASFVAVFVAGMVGQAVVATVSIAGDGASHAVHTTAGIGLGLSLPLLMWRFAAAQPPGRWRARGYAFMGAEIAACVIGVLLSRARRAAIAEVVPAVVFHGWIIVITLRWQGWRGTGPAARRRKFAAPRPADRSG